MNGLRLMCVCCGAVEVTPDVPLCTSCHAPIDFDQWQEPGADQQSPPVPKRIQIGPFDI